MESEGFAWFNAGADDTRPSAEARPEKTSRYQLLDFIEGLAELPTVVADFSQGAIMSAGVALTEPLIISGFGILSGKILPETTSSVAPPEDLVRTTGFIAHGKYDQTRSVFGALQTSTKLKELNVPHQTHLYEMGHEIAEAEVRDFVRWVCRTLRLDINSPQSR